MPSTLVHLAFAGLVAAALLGEAFDRRALAVVLAVTAVPDIDSFAPLVSSLGHRVALHTFVIPLAAGALLWFDLRRGAGSVVRRQWGHRGVRIAWVSLLCYAVAGIGLDLFSGGANPLFPLVDQFYVVDGKIELSTERGLVQTFLHWSEASPIPTPWEVGTSNEVTITTGVDPEPQPEKAQPDRVFPIVRAGWQLLILVVGTAVTAARLALPQRLPREG